MPSKEPAAPPALRPEGVRADAILRVFKVPQECAGMRLDVFLQAQLRNTSRTRARAIVENSAYDLAGRKRGPSERLHADEHVALWRPAFEAELEPVELPVLYEDPYLLAIDKPAMLTVHPTARYHENTLLRRLEARRPGEFLRLLHRLDRETSGVLLLARTPEADRAFKRLLEDRTRERSAGGSAAGTETGRRVSKVYLAITWGTPEATSVDLPLEPDTENRLRVKMRVARPGTGLAAGTEIEVLETRGRYALVRCLLHTGRQHQVRVHLASVGCPVVGDKLYGPDDRLLARAADGELSLADQTALELPRHALHAHVYGMPHAVSGEWIEVRSPLARDLEAFWEALPDR